MLFVSAPSVEELKRRLAGRGSESGEVIQARLERAREEAKGMDGYDYLLINDDLDACVEEMHRIIQAQHARLSQNREFVEHIRKTLGI